MFDPEAAVAFLRDRDPAKLPKWRQRQMSVPDRFGFGAGGTQNGVVQLCPSTSCLQAKPAMAAGKPHVVIASTATCLISSGGVARVQCLALV